MELNIIKTWPQGWPLPDAFFGSLLPTIISLHYISTMTEHEIVVRFKNQYGVKISQNFMHNSLFLVSILKFTDANLNNFVIVHDSLFPELTWCFNSEEILKICEKVARWKSKSARPPRLQFQRL
jgi:hypothetical protein